MPVFIFNVIKKPEPVTKKSATAGYVTIERHCEGMVILDDGVYKVLYKGTKYNITPESYISKNKRIVYARFRCKYGHRIKIIRDIDSRIAVDPRFYIPFSENLVCRGRLVKRSYGSELFHIRVCFNAYIVDDAAKAIKEWQNIINEDDE